MSDNRTDCFWDEEIMKQYKEKFEVWKGRVEKKGLGYKTKMAKEKLEEQFKKYGDFAGWSFWWD